MVTRFQQVQQADGVWRAGSRLCIIVILFPHQHHQHHRHHSWHPPSSTLTSVHTPFAAPLPWLFSAMAACTCHLASLGPCSHLPLWLPCLHSVAAPPPLAALLPTLPLHLPTAAAATQCLHVPRAAAVCVVEGETLVHYSDGSGVSTHNPQATYQCFHPLSIALLLS